MKIVRLARLGAAVLLGAALAAPLQLLILAATPGRRSTMPRLFHRGFLRGLRIRRIVHGRPARGQVLFVANHVSWTDIPLLGAVTGGVFVAKAEVSRWPLVGPLARLHGIVFVERDRARAAGGQAEAVAEHLRRGEQVILFAEGTTSDGDAVLPFKTSLFAAADASPEVAIQPVSLSYTRFGNRPFTGDERRAVAWIGDEGIGPHVTRLAEMPGLTAEIVFHPPVSRADFADRKALARHCQDVIAAGVAALQQGRTPLSGGG